MAGFSPEGLPEGGCSFVWEWPQRPERLPEGGNCLVVWALAAGLAQRIPEGLHPERLLKAPRNDG